MHSLRRETKTLVEMNIHAVGMDVTIGESEDQSGTGLSIFLLKPTSVHILSGVRATKIHAQFC
jgi:hypothetical protein